MNHQKPAARRDAERDATSQAANKRYRHGWPLDRVQQGVGVHGSAGPRKPSFNAAMSSFFIFIIAVMARSDFSSGLPHHSTISRGATCQDSPYLSLSQPQTCALGSPPVAQLAPSSGRAPSGRRRMICNDTASLNLKMGPPLSAVNVWPVELELHRQHRALWSSGAARSPPCRSARSCLIREFGKMPHVEARRLLRPGLVEPEAGRDFLAELAWVHSCFHGVVAWPNDRRPDRHQPRLFSGAARGCRTTPAPECRLSSAVPAPLPVLRGCGRGFPAPVAR